jgi:hypothetical protein
MKIAQLLLFLSVILIFSACKTSSVVLDVLKPAEITVPSHIKKIAVENRCRASTDEKFMNILEGTLTGEGIGMDLEGCDRTLNGVMNILTATPRFQVTHSGMKLFGTGTGVMPDPLSWNEVSKICKNDFADALLVLEAFDSNSNMDVKEKQENVKNKDGSTSTIVSFEAVNRVNVTTAWRLYDPESKTVIDEIRGNDFKEFVGKGNSRESAISNLLVEREAVKEAGYFAGQNYGIRIAPVWIKVSRYYYIKGNDQMKMAAKMAKVNDWQSAIPIWKEVLNDPDYKIAGMAAHNMAVASEVQGSLETAMDWAKKAAYDFKNKNSLNYIKILDERMKAQKKVEKQMQE